MQEKQICGRGGGGRIDSGGRGKESALVRGCGWVEGRNGFKGSIGEACVAKR